MKIIYRFNDGQELLIEVQGEIRDFYLELAGIHPEKVPDALDITQIEERLERKHYRAHKYTGIPVSVEGISENGEQVVDRKDWFSQIEFDIIFEAALGELTDLQRICFVEVNINGKTQRAVASEIGKSRSAVAQAIDGAKKKLKKFSGGI